MKTKNVFRNPTTKKKSKSLTVKYQPSRYTVKKGISRIKTTDYFDADWFSLSESVKKHFNYKCAYCSSRNIEVHHIIPLSRGGTNSRKNLICLCDKHHDSRHKHLPKQRKKRKLK